MEAEKVTIKSLKEEKAIFLAYQKAIRDEEITWHLKSISLPLKFEDKNTSFFHKQ